MTETLTENIALEEEDEALGDINDEESTTSVRSSIFDYPVEHGRRYHAFKDGSYHRPNDEAELERLDIMNHLFLLANGRLHQKSLDPLESHRILDLGTGTGIWAIEVADECPAAEVIGVDISPTMPLMVPPNLRFEVADIEDEWNFSHPFTYIFARYLAGAIKNWPLLMKQTFANLKPEGWAEFSDFDIDYYSQDGSLTEHHALRRWLTMAYGAEAVTQRTLRPGKSLQQWMEEAGFVNIQVLKKPLPLGIWPKDKNLKQIGFLNWTQLWEGLQGMSLRLYLDCLKWSPEELELLLVEVRNDLKNRKLHVLFDLYTVWGQRPA